MIKVQRVGRTIGAIVHGMDLRRVGPDEFRSVKAAFLDHAVLVFRDQHLRDVDHIRFTKLFGPLQVRPNWARDRERIPSDELADISNIDADGNLLGLDAPQRAMNLGDRLWHTDGTFNHNPSLISLLYAREVAPEGGNTEFADMRAAYDALPAEEKDLYERLVVEHDIFRSREQVGFKEFHANVRADFPPALQVLVRQHEETGRRSLYLASHASHILGRDLQEGRSLLQRLIEFATQRQFVYAHSWKAGDLVMWDNRCTMHRAMPFDDLKYRRVMQRSTVIDTMNSVERAVLAGRTLDLPSQALSKVDARVRV